MYASKKGSEFYKKVMYALIEANKKEKDLVAAVNDLRILRGMKSCSYQYVNGMIRGEEKPFREFLDAIENLCGVKITAEEN